LIDATQSIGNLLLQFSPIRLQKIEQFIEELRHASFLQVCHLILEVGQNETRFIEARSSILESRRHNLVMFSHDALVLSNALADEGLESSKLGRSTIVWLLENLLGELEADDRVCKGGNDEKDENFEEGGDATHFDSLTVTAWSLDVHVQQRLFLRKQRSGVQVAFLEVG
jgi:hypothetical protein